MTIKPVNPDKSDSDGSSSHRGCLNKISSPKSPVRSIHFLLLYMPISCISKPPICVQSDIAIVFSNVTFQK